MSHVQSHSTGAVFTSGVSSPPPLETPTVAVSVEILKMIFKNATNNVEIVEAFDAQLLESILDIVVDLRLKSGWIFKNQNVPFKSVFFVDSDDVSNDVPAFCMAAQASTTAKGDEKKSFFTHLCFTRWFLSKME